MLHGLVKGEFGVLQFKVALSKLPAGLPRAWAGGACSPEITSVRLLKLKPTLYPGLIESWH